MNVCPVWVHKCVFPHVSQAEELRGFLTLSGVNRLVRLSVCVLVCFGSGAPEGPRGQVAWACVAVERGSRQPWLILSLRFHKQLLLNVSAGAAASCAVVEAVGGTF